MDFKRNWSKLVLAIFAILGAIAFFVAMVDKIGDRARFPLIAFDIMGLVFFVGTALYLFLKMFDLGAAKYIMLATGIITLVLLCIYLFAPIMHIGTFRVNGWELWFGKRVPAAYRAGLGRTFGGIAYSATQIGFAITAVAFPLIQGIKKVCCKNEGAVSKRTAAKTLASK
jgi:heme/copper-type cytochrome/quinol oxidase subunit 4